MNLAVILVNAIKTHWFGGKYKLFYEGWIFIEKNRANLKRETTKKNYCLVLA